MTEKTVDLKSDLEFDDFRYANFKYLLFNDFCDSPIRIQQDFKMGKGGILWDASYVISCYLNQINLTGKKVLELGAGTALPSVLCGIKGAETYASDIFPALSLTSTNISLNQSLFTSPVTPVNLDWTDALTRQNIPNIRFDYIILSDVFYLPVWNT
jgi:Lysine methyltransferase